jgi:hypothetical protein
VTKFSFVLSRYKIDLLSEYKPNPPRGKWSIPLVLSRYTASTPAGRTIISGIGSQVEGCRVSIPIFERVKKSDLVCVVSITAPLFFLPYHLPYHRKYHSRYELHVVIYDSMFHSGVPL